MPESTLIQAAIDILQTSEAVYRTLDRVNERLGAHDMKHEDVLAFIVTEGQRLLPPDTQGEFLLLRENRLVIVASTAPAEIGDSLRADQGVSGWVLQRREPALIADLHNPKSHPAVRAYVQKLPGMRSEITAPLYAGSSVIGVLNYENPRPAAFTQPHLEFLSRLAAGAAAAVYVSERQREIMQVADVMRRSLVSRPQEVYEALVKTTLFLTDADRAQLLEYDGLTGTLSIVASTNESDLLNPQVNLERSVCGVVLREKRLVNVPDVTAPAWRGRFEQRLGADVRSELAVPVFAGDAISHILNVESPRRENFRYADEESLTALTAVVRLATDFAATFRQAFHQIARPINAIGWQVEALLADEAAPPGQAANRLSPERRRESLLTAKRNVDYLKHLLGMLKPGPINLQPVSLRQVLDDVLPLFAEGDLSRVEVRIDAAGIAELPPVQGERWAIGEVARNLIENALDALTHGSRPIPKPKLWIECGPRKAGRVGLVFRDNGPGIKKEHLKRIFEPLFTTKGAKGTGVGLAFVQEKMAKMDGRIEPESEGGKGAAFTLYFRPVAAAAFARWSPPRKRGARRAVVYDAKAETRELGRRSLTAEGCRVVSTDDPDKALDAFGRADAAVFVLDGLAPAAAQRLIDEVRVRARDRRPGDRVLVHCVARRPGAEPDWLRILDWARRGVIRGEIL